MPKVGEVECVKTRYRVFDGVPPATRRRCAGRPTFRYPAAVKPGTRPVALALILGGLFGLTGVAAGAFGAHGLKQSVSASDLEIWKTGAHYQQLHAAVLIGVAGAARYLSPSQVRVIVSLLTVGIVVFAGALYTLALGGPRWLGAVAPVGGLSLMAGWAMIVVSALRSRPVD